MLICVVMAILLGRLKYILFQNLTLYFIMGICSARNIPAMFIFGDSLVDVGNNNYFATIARPTFPNGIDFGSGNAASGRYTNGRTFADILGQELGFVNFTPPYLASETVRDVVLKGVNYASSGSGIFNDTGKIFGGYISLDTQIIYFEKTKQDIMTRIGTTAAENLLKQSLFTLTIGSNDILTRGVSSKGNTSWEAYIDKMISKFRSQLTRLYYLGARKIMVTNISPLGCLPFERDFNPLINGCVESLNQMAKYYNSRLKGLLTELTKNLTGSIFINYDLYAVSEEVLQNYKSYGFENADSACCHVAGSHGGLMICFFASQVCQNRTKYLFWDPFHPTETANLIVVKYIMDGGLKYMSPINIRQLVNISPANSVN